MTAYVICKRCGFKIPLAVKLRSEAPVFFSAMCPSCGFKGVYSYTEIIEEGVYRATCLVCGVRLYSFRLGPAKCPVCGSRYMITPDKWQLIETGSPPPKPTQVLGTVGLVAGAVTSAGKGKSTPEKVANIIAGATVGLLVGTLLGAFFEVLTQVEREVIYE